MGDLIPIIIFLVIIIASGMRKLFKTVGQQQETGTPTYTAPSSDVEEFLERTRRMQAGQQEAEGEPRWENPIAELIEEPRPQEEQRVEIFDFLRPPQPLRPQPPLLAVGPAPTAVRPAERKKAAPRPRKPRSAAAARPRVQPKKKAPAPPAEGRIPLHMSRSDLRQAVVWSEILGRPVSMRRHRGHRPPTLSR